MSEACYTYAILQQELTLFSEKFPHIPIFSVGKSRQGRDLTMLRLGTGGHRVLFHGAHHGMEWLTAKLLMVFATELAENIHHTAKLLKRTSLYLLPMVNPDGVEIAATGKRWQANGAGVDLNHNYDALWHLSKQGEKAAGIDGPGPTRFSGPYPESEPESRALADFTRQNRLDLAIAFHSQGEVFYWDFCGYAPEESYAYIRRFEEVSPYRADQTCGIAAYGGYKDWFLRTFRKPGFTVEIGKGENPLPMEDFPQIYARTLPLMLAALEN